MCKQRKNRHCEQDWGGKQREIGKDKGGGDSDRKMWEEEGK